MQPSCVFCSGRPEPNAAQSRTTSQLLVRRFRANTCGVWRGKICWRSRMFVSDRCACLFARKCSLTRGTCLQNCLHMATQHVSAVVHNVLILVRMQNTFRQPAEPKRRRASVLSESQGSLQEHPLSRLERANQPANRPTD